MYDHKIRVTFHYKEGTQTITGSGFFSRQTLARRFFVKKGWTFVLVLLSGLLLGCQEIQEKGDAATVPSFVALPTEATERQAAEAGTFLGETWQEVYRQILLADPESYLPAADADFDPQNRTFYLGLHDYDRDEIPELIIGDLSSGAVFTFREGAAQKLADLYLPGVVWCINSLYARGDGLSLQCSGSGGTDFVSFGYLDGEYLLGYYTQIGDDYNPPVINGSPATLEQMNRLYPTEESALRAEDRKRPAQLVQTEEAWALHLSTGEIIPPDRVFTSQAFFWE